MDLEHSFTVPVPRDRAWNVLLDVERVAPCMPGATLDAADGDVITGRIKVKVGPITMTYAGTARFTEKNEQAGEILMEAAGKETRGAGTASASVRSVLEDLGTETRVIVYTSLNVTGKPAQFGRGVMAEIGGKLIGIFAANLAEMLTADEAGLPAAGEAGLPAGEAGLPAEGPGSLFVPRPSGVAPAGAGEGSLAAPARQGRDALALPLEELRLPLRSYNSLRREGVHTIGDLAALDPQQLLAIEKIGPASVDEIRQRLAEHSLTLGAAPAAGPELPGPELPGPAWDVTTVGPAPGAPEVAAPEFPGPAITGPAAAAAIGAAAGAGGPAAGGNGTGPASAPDTAAMAGGGGTSPRPQPTPQPFAPTRPGDDDAIDLLSVAGMPVLKRAAPVLAVLIAVILAVLGLRRRQQDRNS